MTCEFHHQEQLPIGRPAGVRSAMGQRPLPLCVRSSCSPESTGWFITRSVRKNKSPPQLWINRVRLKRAISTLVRCGELNNPYLYAIASGTAKYFPPHAGNRLTEVPQFSHQGTSQFPQSDAGKVGTKRNALRSCCWSLLVAARPAPGRGNGQ